MDPHYIGVSLRVLLACKAGVFCSAIMFFSGNNAIPPSWTLKLPESWGKSKTEFKGEDDGITALFTNTRTPSQLRFSLPSIIITITSNEPWNTETHKTDRNTPITNHKPRPFEPVKVKFCFLRGPLRWLTTAKNANGSWLLNFRIRVFLKSALK